MEALFLIYLALYANLSVDKVSGKLVLAADMAAIINVLIKKCIFKIIIYFY